MNNHNDVGIKNGNIFGFEVQEKEAELILIPVPWEVTASYGTGSSFAPSSILEASTQLDFYHPILPNAWQQKIFMKPISYSWHDISKVLSSEMKNYHNALQKGKCINQFSELLKTVSNAQKELRKGLRNEALTLLKKDKKVGVLGGEHSVPLGLYEAYSKTYKKFGILQFDAHADLRKSYQNIKESHASIMFNALKVDNISKLVQVGVRDLCEYEMKIINQNSKIKTYFDWNINEREFEGETWKDTTDKIIKSLPQKVHISFDIDCLSPEYCKTTGTPVPGGLSYSKAIYIIQQLAQSKKEIIGFDLCEVVPGKTELEANIGARVLWELCCAIKMNSTGIII